MSYSKERLTASMKSILGEIQLESLGLPRAVEEAAVMMFLQDSPSITDSLIVREALVDLRRTGSFKFTSKVYKLVLSMPLSGTNSLAVVMADKSEIEQLRQYLLSDERHGFMPSEIREVDEPTTPESFADWLNS